MTSLWFRNGPWAVRRGQASSPSPPIVHEIGTLEVGKRSDLMRPSIDPFTAADHEIHPIDVVRTMLGGRFTHGPA